MKIHKIVRPLVEASIKGDKKAIELLALSAMRALNSIDKPEAELLAKTLSKHSVNPDSVRWRDMSPFPVDADAGGDLLRLVTTEDAPQPILSSSVAEKIERFLLERKRSETLYKHGLAPASSILLYGAPGTGKTMLSKWIARVLELQLVVFDLSSSISSYLGKTGANIRKTFDYARRHSCVILLDEFDAIAKRRDDQSDVGELKRIVNVLLKELEDLPASTVYVAATNHVQMLDPAIERRFDMSIELELPNRDERRVLVNTLLQRHDISIDEKFAVSIAESMNGVSHAVIDLIVSRSIRRSIIEGLPTELALVGEVVAESRSGVNSWKDLASSLRKVGGLTFREIADLIQIPHTTVHYELTKKTSTRRKQDARTR